MASIDIAMEKTSQEILSKVANGVEPSFRSPISANSGDISSGNTASGTGKGIIHFHYPNNNVKATLVIDGIKMIDTTCLSGGYGGEYVFEFTKSFSLTATSGYLKYIAIFY